jgi:hypothetical protein
MARVEDKFMNIVVRVLSILIVLNIVCLVFFVSILIASTLGAGALLDAMLKSAPRQDPAALLAALRMVMAIGIAVVPLAHVLLTRLKAMVETVRAGDPFVAANSDRLQLIAWCLLGIQICDLAFGAVSMTLGAEADPMSGWTLSLTGWLAVALLFVLARVFAHGTRMRDELEGTV